MTPSLPGYAALAALTGLALWSAARPGGWAQHRALFAALLALTIIAAHAPTLGWRDELPNPDEAQLLAGALTLQHHFAPWLSVDLSTAGPVSVLPLLPLPVNFQIARWLAALCAATAVVFSWLALTSARDHPVARIVALPVAAFFVFMESIELFQFSTEHVAAVLLAGAAWIWLAATAGGDQPSGRAALAGFGLCLGAAFMAKLQSAPCGAWLALAAGGLVLGDSRLTWSRRSACFAALLAGCAVAPVFFFLLAAAQGVLPDLLNSYVRNNFQYVTDMPRGSTGYQPGMIWGLNYLLKPVGGLLLVGLLFVGGFTPAERRTSFLLLGGLAAAITAIVLPGRGSGHYWLFVFGPVLLAFGSVALPAWRRLAAHPSVRPAWRRWAPPGLALLLLGLPLAHRLRSSRDEALTGTMGRVSSVREAGEKLRGLARRGDTLTVWGWRAELHVHSQLPQGTREAHTQWLIEPVPQQAYYRRRFLGDLAHTRPRFIADAVGPQGFAYTDRAASGHETFAELNRLLARDYNYIGETAGVRLYIRHEP